MTALQATRPVFVFDLGRHGVPHSLGCPAMRYDVGPVEILPRDRGQERPRQLAGPKVTLIRLW